VAARELGLGVVDREVENCKLLLHQFNRSFEFDRTSCSKECIITIDNCKYFRPVDSSKYLLHDLVLDEYLEKA